MIDNMQDNAYMSHALSLAKQGEFTAHPNPMVGCVIVANEHIVGMGSHLRCGEAHAEINALKQAGSDAQGATLYVTLEPCSHMGRTGPCVDALIQAGIKRVVIATQDPNPQVCGKGINALEAAGILVTQGVMANEAMSLNPGFFSRITRQKPYVRAKLGMSLDAKVAMQNGQSQWITSSEARRDVQHFRGRSGAILTTSATVLQDNCRLTVREIASVNTPLRVVIDTHLKSPSNSLLFKEPGKVVVVVSEKVAPEAIDKWLQAVNSSEVDCIGLPLNKQHVDFTVLLNWLAENEVNDVFVEAGGHFLGALLQEELVDELLIYVAPKLMGNNTIGMANLPHIQQLNENIDGKFIDVERVGPDIRLRIALSDFARLHHGHS
jgi:diaminohydroxyphosphoribosylaminopyrimidine deaminase/5-amino-6-(5-phosphoribosylamino)uracil reductase